MTIHCDSNVLHAPGECVYCDKYGKIEQQQRKNAKINFTGHHDTDKTMCPSEHRRPLDIINLWGGNVAKTQEQLDDWKNWQQRFAENLSKRNWDEDITTGPVIDVSLDEKEDALIGDIEKLRSRMGLSPLKSSLTTDPTDPDLGHGQDNEPGPQNKKYLVLSEEERNKGFIRPFKDEYIHYGEYPNYPLQDLTQEQHERYDKYHYVKYEKYPEGGLASGKYWTQEQLDKKVCGAVTKMGRALSETYARDPTFYGYTYCVGCRMHKPVGEFRWTLDNEIVGS